MSLKTFWANNPVPQWILILAAFVWAGFVDQARAWVLEQVTMHPAAIPVFLFSVGVFWMVWFYVQPPRLKIVCDTSIHPYRQEWDDKGGHQILFRVGVKNLSNRKAVNKAEIKLTSIEPFEIQCVPVHLKLMNRGGPWHEFFLPPGATQYVDVLQQSQPSGDLYIWHGLYPEQDAQVKPRNYIITLTVFGDNISPLSERFSVAKEGAVYTLRLKD